MTQVAVHCRFAVGYDDAGKEIPAEGRVSVAAIDGLGGNEIPVADPDGNTIFKVGGQGPKHLDGAGRATFRLPASDDPGLQPTGFLYRFVFTPKRGRGGSVHEVEVLSSAAPETDLSDIAPAQAVEASDTFVLQAVFDAHAHDVIDGGSA